jgi:hypothetical protein
MKPMETELAGDILQTMEVVGPLGVNFKNRTTSYNAAVLPSEFEVFLGAITMKEEN